VTTRGRLTVGALPVAQTERSGCRPDGLVSRALFGPLVRAGYRAEDLPDRWHVRAAASSRVPNSVGSGAPSTATCQWPRLARSLTLDGSEAFVLTPSCRARRLASVGHRDCGISATACPGVPRCDDGQMEADRLSTRPADRSDT
jgi:hypothetical protein